MGRAGRHAPVIALLSDLRKRLPSWRRSASGILVAASLVAVAIGLWFLSPSTDREFSFALLALASIAAILSAVQLLRGEAHQTATTTQLAQVASLVQVQAALEVGFSGGEEDDTLSAIEVAPDWTDRGGPAIKVLHDMRTAVLAPKVPASDLVRVSFRVSNRRGRDPAMNVFCKFALPDGTEAYAEDDFRGLLDAFDAPRGIQPGEALIVKSQRRDIRFSWDTITNGTWATTRPIWLRLPSETGGQVSISFYVAADRIPPIGGQLVVNVK